jgi:hypothetical protein
LVAIPPGLVFDRKSSAPAGCLPHPGELLPVAVLHDKGRADFLHRPGRREAAVGIEFQLKLYEFF